MQTCCFSERPEAKWLGAYSLRESYLHERAAFFFPSIFHLKQSPTCIIKMLIFRQIGENTGSSSVSPRGKQNNFIGDFNLDVHCESFQQWERFNVNFSWFRTDIISKFHLFSFGKSNSASKFTPDWFLSHENSHWIIVNTIRKRPHVNPHGGFQANSSKRRKQTLAKKSSGYTPLPGIVTLIKRSVLKIFLSSHLSHLCSLSCDSFRLTGCKLYISLSSVSGFPPHISPVLNTITILQLPCLREAVQFQQKGWCAESVKVLLSPLDPAVLGQLPELEWLSSGVYKIRLVPGQCLLLHNFI